MSKTFIENEVKNYIDSDHKYRIIDENIYNYKNYTNLLLFLFVILFFIYIIGVAKMYN